MEEAFLDVRVQRTMKKITQALILLLKEKSLGEITVKEIITKAKISRGTVYLHYQDKNDLIQKLKNNYFHHFFPQIQRAFDGQRIDFFLEALNFLKGEGELIALLLSTNGYLAVQNDIRNVLQQYGKKYLVKQLKGETLTPLEEHYFVIYYSNAAFSVMQEWLNRGQQESPEEMMNILDAIVPKEFFR